MVLTLDCCLIQPIIFQIDERKNVQLPWRWMAPELLKYTGKLNFTEKSDVWSFGVTIYEVYSLGYQPYFNRKQIQDVIDYLCIQKGTLEVPDSCPEIVSAILKNC